MTRTVTLAGFAVLTAAMLAWQALAVLVGRTATLGQAITTLTRRRAGRPVLLVAWLWLGWHLFVRGAYL